MTETTLRVATDGAAAPAEDRLDAQRKVERISDAGRIRSVIEDADGKEARIVAPDGAATVVQVRYRPPMIGWPDGVLEFRRPDAPSEVVALPDGLCVFARPEGLCAFRLSRARPAAPGDDTPRYAIPRRLTRYARRAHARHRLAPMAVSMAVPTSNGACIWPHRVQDVSAAGFGVVMPAGVEWPLQQRTTVRIAVRGVPPGTAVVVARSTAQIPAGLRVGLEIVEMDEAVSAAVTELLGQSPVIRCDKPAPRPEDAAVAAAAAARESDTPAPTAIAS
jgi:hypothetical protein